MKVVRVDHIGIAVRNLADAVKVYETLGLSHTETEEVPGEKVNVAVLPVGKTRLELLEATAADSAIAKYLEKRGEGIHHIALEVDGLEEACDELKAAGFRLVYPEPRKGEGGALVNFVHPSSAMGVLIELREGRKTPTP